MIRPEKTLRRPGIFIVTHYPVMMRVKVAEWLFTLLGIATLTRLTMGTELHHATVCYGMVLSHPPRCDEGSNINVLSVLYDTRDTCPDQTSCGHPAVNRTLYDVIRSQCDRATECLTNTNEAFWDSVICPPGNWVDVLYTCQTYTQLNATTVRELMDNTTSGLNTQLTEITTEQAALVDNTNQRLTALNLVLIPAVCVPIGVITLLSIILAVVCIKRRRQNQVARRGMGQQMAPLYDTPASPGTREHRSTGANVPGPWIAPYGDISVISNDNPLENRLDVAPRLVDNSQYSSFETSNGEPREVEYTDNVGYLDVSNSARTIGSVDNI